MEKVTVDQVNKAISERCISYWRVRDCSICGGPVSYFFADGAAYLDTNCGCARYRTPPFRKTIREFIGGTFNLQTSPEVRANMWAEFLSSGVNCMEVE